MAALVVLDYMFCLIFFSLDLCTLNNPQKTHFLSLSLSDAAYVDCCCFFLIIFNIYLALNLIEKFVNCYYFEVLLLFNTRTIDIFKWFTQKKVRKIQLRTLLLIESISIFTLYALLYKIC